MPQVRWAPQRAGSVIYDEAVLRANRSLAQLAYLSTETVTWNNTGPGYDDGDPLCAGERGRRPFTVGAQYPGDEMGHDAVRLGVPGSAA